MTDGRLQNVIQRLCQSAGAANPSAVRDGELLERFVASADQAAFELLVWRYQRLVLGVCRRVLRHSHEAEDAFQATFLALARKAGSISQRDALGSWLYQVAYRIALKAGAQSGQRARHERQGLDLSAVAAAEAVAGDDLQPALDRELSGLPEKYRAPLVLCYLEGKSYDEAALQLGCPKGTVSTRLTYARELLRKRLVRRGLALSVAALASLGGAPSASAGVPPTLLSSTVGAAVLYASGKSALPGVAPGVVALADGAVRGLFLGQVKMLAAVLAAGLLCSGMAVGYRTLGRAPAVAAAASAPRGIAAPDVQPPDVVPEGLRGFNGVLVGKLVRKFPDRGSLVLEVREVKPVARASKAANPESAVGKTLQIDGVFGRFSEALAALQPGESIQIATQHVKGDHLTFLGEELKKAPLPVK